MTKEQVNACLAEVDESPSTWTTLEGKFTHLNLQCDNNIIISPKTTQFYFDDQTELVFMRHTFGKPKLLADGEAIPRGYVSVPHNGKAYAIKLEESGANDKTIGRFHEVVSYELLVGMFKLPEPPYALKN